MAKEYNALDLDRVLEILSKPAPTCILFHVHPDADAVGSAFALAAFLRTMGSRCYCLCADEMPERLAFLVKDFPQTSVLPESLPAEFENARFITVDTASPQQLGRLYELYGDRISLMIDHHEKGEPYADNLIRPGAAACGEIIFDLIAASRRNTSKHCAALLYAAISSDTGGFRFSNVSAGTFLRAAALVETGQVDVAALSHQLFEVKTKEILCAERLAFDNLHLYEEGRIGISAISLAEKQANGLTDEHLTTAVDVVRSVEGVEIAVALRQPDTSGKFRVSMRANVDFDVSAVCATFGGGGHVRAAGATVTAPNVAAAESKVLAALLEARGQAK